MKESLRDVLLGQYGVRKTNAQKRAFIRWAEEYAASLGVPAAVEASGAYIPSRNIVFGDVDRARTIITAHYDTCARLPFPNASTPGCLPLFALEQILLTGGIVLFGWLCGSGVSALLPLAVPAWAAGLLSVAAGFAGAMLLLALMLAGPANPHNANDNTSGVLLVLLAMARLKDRPGIAYVLFDNEEKGLLGSSAFIQMHPQAARRFVLNFDCVGDGKTLLYTGMKGGMRTPQAKRLLAALEETAPTHGLAVASGPFPKWIYPSDQLLFPRGTAVAALKGKRILYMDRIHTHRDTVLEERNIDCLLDAIERAGL